jgi:hypothetical protein
MNSRYGEATLTRGPWEEVIECYGFVQDDEDEEVAVKRMITKIEWDISEKGSRVV